MTELNDESASDKIDPSETFRNLMRNKLKDVSNVQIENAIAQCITDLIGCKYVCKIEKIDYGNERGRESTIRMTLAELIPSTRLERTKDRETRQLT